MLTGFSTQTSARCSLKQDQKVALDRPESSVPQSTSLSAQASSGGLWFFFFCLGFLWGGFFGFGGVFF